jgi:hypothetical protein
MTLSTAADDSGRATENVRSGTVAADGDKLAGVEASETTDNASTPAPSALDSTALNSSVADSAADATTGYGPDGGAETATGNSKDFAAGENLSASGALPQTSGADASEEAPASKRQPRKETKKTKRYREIFAAIQGSEQLAARSDGDAKEHRDKLFVAVAELAYEHDFDLSEFCFANGLKSSKPRRKKPCLAVLQAVFPEPEYDRKLASKWGTALQWAYEQSRSLNQELCDYLRGTTIEECVRECRKEKSSAEGTRTTAKSRPSGLVISGAPSALNGRVDYARKPAVPHAAPPT